MNILITGGAGVLGSSLCKMFVEKGYNVSVMDIIRKEEAWRLFDCFEKIRYNWKSEIDINVNDINGADIVFDCAIGSADRPFSSDSPMSASLSNLLPPMNLLETVKKKEKGRPIVVYPSSFNSLYGHNKSTMNENLLPLPTSVYGWTKASAELMYLSYHNAYSIPVIITRTASSFGPTGRSDELPHKLILSAIGNKESFLLKSPRAKRLWTYVGDVTSFYSKLVDRIDDLRDVVMGKILHLGGNKGDIILENIEFAKLIKKECGSEIELVESYYEEGEFVKGAPVSFSNDASWTRKLLGWEPQYTIESGLKMTIEWFRNNYDRYGGL